MPDSQQLSAITLPYNATIRQALSLLGEENLRMLLVVDSSQKFIGILTDPDIRKGLLNGLELDSSIETIINIHPVVASINDSNEKLFELSSVHNIYEIPILDDKGDVLRIQSVLKLLKTKQYPNEIVIVLEEQSLLKVNNKPILQLMCEKFAKIGFSKIVLCVDNKSDVEEYFGDGKKFGVEISYIKEEKSMGAAGGLSLLVNKPTEPFIVLYGNELIDVDLLDLLNYHISNEALATMYAREYNYQVPYSVINQKEGKILDITEKPIQNVLVNSGIYVLSPSVLEFISKDEFLDMTNLFKILIEKNSDKVFCYKEGGGIIG